MSATASASARRRYAELAKVERDWSGADLISRGGACHNKIDNDPILPRVDRPLDWPLDGDERLRRLAALPTPGCSMSGHGTGRDGFVMHL